MATDRYNRIVLTVIAACLVYLCVRDAASPALAQSQRPLEVVLVGMENKVSNEFAWRELPVRVNGPVKVEGPLDVYVKK